MDEFWGDDEMNFKKLPDRRARAIEFWNRDLRKTP